MAAALDPVLARVLDRTSRSFSLSLKALPRETRGTLAVAYLLARAADTVADTRLVAREVRLGLLRRLAASIRPDVTAGEGAGLVRELGARLTGASPVAEERELLERTGDVLLAYAALPELERRLVQGLLATITAGMVLDLERFPADDAGGLAALDELDELDRYCWHVAGCVGELWTELHLRRLPSLAGADAARLRALAPRFGRALQMTNVLRDVPRDLAHGRCYLPLRLLRAVGLEPRELLHPGVAWPRLRPLFRWLVARTTADARAAHDYVLALPASEPGLRLATALPVLLAHPTLALLGRGNPLDPRVRRKVPRREVALATLLGGVAVALDRVAGTTSALGSLLERAARASGKTRPGAAFLAVSGAAPVSFGPATTEVTS